MQPLMWPNMQKQNRKDLELENVIELHAPQSPLAVASNNILARVGMHALASGPAKLTRSVTRPSINWAPVDSERTHQ